MDDVANNMYQVYRVQRRFIVETRQDKLTYNDFLFRQRVQHICDELDTLHPEFMNRWLSENDDV